MARFAALVLLAMFCFIAACTKPDTGKTGKVDSGKICNIEKGTLVELKPSPEGFPLGLSVSQGFAIHMFDTPGANQGFRKFPHETGFKRYYDEFTIAGKAHLVITEESNPPRLYFDENRNGDLTDDRPPFEGEKQNLVPNNYSIQILYEDEKVVAPYRLWMFSSPMGGVRFYPTCHWQSTVPVNGNRYKIVAFDANADGDYSNDAVVIDVNGNDKADEDEKLTPGQSLSIDGQRVTLLSISPSGLTVRLEL